jgi:hypothetical protein
MPRLFAPVRAVFAGAMLAIGLGCGGALNGALQLAGVDVNIAIGESAVHPDDFPAKTPVKGVKAMSMRFNAPGESINMPPDIQMPDGVTFTEGTDYALDIVVYTVDSADLSSLCATAKEQVLASGWASKDASVNTDPEIKEVALFGQDQNLFVVMGTDDGDSATMVLLRSVPKLAEGEVAEEPAAVEVDAPEEDADDEEAVDEGQATDAEPEAPTE